MLRRAPHLPNVGKDDQVQDPLQGTIVPTLDEGDFVCLVLENIVPAGAAWHDTEVPARLMCTRGLKDQPNETSELLAGTFSLESSKEEHRAGEGGPWQPPQLCLG